MLLASVSSCHSALLTAAGAKSSTERWQAKPAALASATPRGRGLTDAGFATHDDGLASGRRPARAQRSLNCASSARRPMNGGPPAAVRCRADAGLTASAKPLTASGRVHEGRGSMRRTGRRSGCPALPRRSGATPGSPISGDGVFPVVAARGLPPPGRGMPMCTSDMSSSSPNPAWRPDQARAAARSGSAMRGGAPNTP